MEMVKVLEALVNCGMVLMVIGIGVYLYTDVKQTKESVKW